MYTGRSMSWADDIISLTSSFTAANNMVNIGLTKVDDALAAKHPVGLSFYSLISIKIICVDLCWTLTVKWISCPILKSVTCTIKLNESVLGGWMKAVFSLSGSGELRSLSVSRLHEGDGDLHSWWVTWNLTYGQKRFKLQCHFVIILFHHNWIIKLYIKNKPLYWTVLSLVTLFFFFFLKFF